MDVLYLSISMGAGHLRAAEALKEYVDQMYPQSRSLVVDTFKYINPLVHKIFVDGYLSIVRSIPNAYGTLYRMSEQSNNLNNLSRALSKLLSFSIARLIKDFNPSIIVCTHPFPLQIVSYLKKQKIIKVPALGILTDYVNHPFWLQDNIEAYVVAHNKIKEDMISKGTPEKHIYSYGIPVSKVFLQRKSKKELLQRYGLKDKFTVLLMGGSLGFGNIKKTLMSLVNCESDIQIIVVTGKNKRLKQQLEKLLGQYSKDVHLIGYSKEIYSLMDVADVIVTKPGGMTITEAFLKELPIFIMSPIPGQEERNLHFLLSTGAAESIDKDTDINNLIHRIIDNPYILTEMKEKSKKLSTPDSGYKIVSLMEKLVSNHI